MKSAFFDLFLRSWMHGQTLGKSAAHWASMLDSSPGLEMTVLSLQRSIISCQLIPRIRALKLFTHTFGIAARDSGIFDPSHNSS